MSGHNETYKALQAENEQLRQRVAELEQAEQRIQAVLGGITDIMLVMDQDGRYLEILPTKPDLLYKPSQDLLGKTLHDVMPTTLADHFVTAIREVLSTRMITTVEYALPLPDGEVWFGATVNPVSDTTIVLVARDITERKRAEETLKRDQEFFLRGPLVFFKWGASEDWPVDYVSPNVVNIFGHSAEDFVSGRVPYATTVYPEDLQRVTAEVQAYSAARVPTFEQEYRIIDAHGDIRWIYDFTTVIRNEQGDSTHYYGYVLDITTRKQSEEELRIFQTLIEHIPDAVGIANLSDGTLIYGNPAQRQLYAYGEDIVGTSFSEYFVETAECRQNLVEETLTQGVWRGVLTNKRRDGSTFPGHITGVVIKDAAGQPQWIMGIVRDLTAQQRAEEERAALQQQIIAAQQAAIRELSTPLIPITQNAVIMPLIGSIDTQRTQQIMETLLEGVAHYQAEIAILDITGVHVVDAQVANALIRVAKAVKLLGAKVVLTGIQPGIAQTLVHLGVELSGIIARSTLQAGITYALGEH